MDFAGSLGRKMVAPQALRSLVDASFNLQGEPQVHYPNLHENPENNISPIKCITNKLLSLNKASM